MIVCNVMLRRLKQDRLRGLQLLRQFLGLGREGRDLDGTANGLLRDADLTGSLFDAAPFPAPALVVNRAKLARFIFFLSLCRRFPRVLLLLGGGDLDPARHQFGALDLAQFPAVQVLGRAWKAEAGTGPARKAALSLD